MGSCGVCLCPLKNDKRFLIRRRAIVKGVRSRSLRESKQKVIQWMLGKKDF